MSYETYKIMHFAGILLTFTALGIALGDVARRRFAAALHGIGLLLVLVGGFGLHAVLTRMGTVEGFPAWLIVKLAVWLLIGLAPFVIKRRRDQATAIVLGCVLLGVAAAWMAAAKPIG